MANKNKGLIIVGIIIVIIILLLSMKGCNYGGGGSANNTTGGGGGSGGGTTIYIHDPCSDCQARWLNLRSWECTGSCKTGECKVDGFYSLTDPYVKPECTCETQTDTCRLVGSTCEGTCSNGGVCSPSLTHVGCYCIEIPR